MIRYILRRLLWAVPTLWIVITLSFFLIRFAPGTPFTAERNFDAATMAEMNAYYNLDKPLWQQYFIYLGRISQGDLGPSMKYKGRSVNEFLAQGLPVSIQLGVFALVLAVILGTTAGVVAALRQNRWQDYSAMTLSMLGISVPSFVAAPILIVLFAVQLRWFNVTGWESWKDMILPGVTLGSRYMAYIARLTRAGMLEVIRQDHVRTARAKGVSEFFVVWRHSLRGAILPLVSFLGPATAGIVTGSLVIEKIFGIPGIGRTFINAAFNRDLYIVMGIVITYSALLILMNLIVDILYGFLDPRVRYE